MKKMVTNSSVSLLYFRDFEKGRSGIRTVKRHKSGSIATTGQMDSDIEPLDAHPLRRSSIDRTLRNINHLFSWKKFNYLEKQVLHR